MIRTIAAASLALLALLVPAAAENGYQELTGEFYVLEGVEEMPPTMYIGLTGEAARVVYEGIAAPAETNECMGGLMKFMQDGGYCTLSEDGQHFCSFSIELATGKFMGGESC
jgi:hypothetical protein